MTLERPPLQILSVEDDALNRALVRASLARSEERRISAAALIEVTSLAEARLALAGSSFDFVLLDRRLPDGDGFDLARELRAAPGSKRPVVIGLTADAVPQTAAAAMDAGCDALLTKPFAPTELVAAVERNLRGASG